MLKKEFENLVGHSVSDECYERIEVVYMESEYNFDKKGIAEFYRQEGMNGIDRECSIIKKNRMISNLKEQLTKEKEKNESLQAKIDQIHKLLWE